MSPNLQEFANLVTFTEEILDGELHLLCSVEILNGKIHLLCSVEILNGKIHILCSITF